MMDIPTAVLFFGFPIGVLLLGWVAVKLHERSAPEVKLPAYRAGSDLVSARGSTGTPR
jgi:hypothetical protein